VRLSEPPAKAQPSTHADSRKGSKQKREEIRVSLSWSLQHTLSWRPLVGHEKQHHLAEQRIRTIYIDPGIPWQNGFVKT
jgi:hypothetical protein